jgi:hypothetical protein
MNMGGASVIWRALMRAVLACALVFSFDSFAATPKKVEKVEAAPELTEQELVEIRALLDKLAAAFLAGDAAAVNLLVESNLRDRAADNIESEFKQSRYMVFQILQVLPDDTLRENVHSVDVRFRFALIDRNWAPELQDSFLKYIHVTLADAHSIDKPINMEDVLKGFIKHNNLQERMPRLTEPDVNTSSQTFVVQKTKDGFKIRDSSFFDNLGVRQGMGLVVEGLLSAMAVCALLSFWVWMGWEALRARPRYTIWRWVVLIPIAGACAFFFAAYLPRQLKGYKQQAL